MMMNRNLTAASFHALIFLLLLMMVAIPSCADPLGNYDHASVLAPPDLDKTAEPETAIKVMTFNLRYAHNGDGDNAWDNRKELLIRTIRDTDPDLLGTQECLKVQADYLKEHLPDYAFVGVGRADGKDQGEMSALFIRKSKFDLINSGTFWLSETPDKPGSVGWDAALTRIATWANLRLRDQNAPAQADAQEILFCNTHFDHRGVSAREHSASLLRSKITSLRSSPHEPLIITGDFNTAADPSEQGGPHVEQTYHNLIDGPAPHSQHWQDCYLKIHPILHEDQPSPTDQGTFHSFTGHPTSPDRIDWIVTTPDFTVIDAQIIRTHSADGHYPSDHFPVSATVILPPPTP